MKEVRRKEGGVLASLNFIHSTNQVFYCAQRGIAGEAWAEVRTPVLLPGICHELPAYMALDEFLSFSVFICRRRQSFKSLPALLHGSYRLMGKDTETPVSCRVGKVHTQCTASESPPAHPFHRCGTEAWMYERLNVELSSSLPPLSSLLIQGQR